MKIRLKNKRRFISVMTFTLIIVIFIIAKIVTNQSKKQMNSIQVSENIEDNDDINNRLPWELTLVNSDNEMPENYELELEDIDEYRKFDKRAIGCLRDMLDDIINDGITNVWVQSAYRSVEDQVGVYNAKIEEYEAQGKTKEEAIKLTEEVINKPECSDHNLGLAVDFNYVKEDFENTKAFKWLTKNAENYGFILRYPKGKEYITKVDYEPWHWRYVGEENAKKMNELNMCLEEYVEYLNK